MAIAFLEKYDINISLSHSQNIYFNRIISSHISYGSEIFLKKFLMETTVISIRYSLNLWIVLLKYNPRRKNGIELTFIIQGCTLVLQSPILLFEVRNVKGKVYCGVSVTKYKYTWY